MSRRRSPRRHKVFPRHPRYKVRVFERGVPTEYINKPIQEYISAIFYPDQKIEQFKEGDVIAIWEPTDYGFVLRKPYKILRINPTNVKLLDMNWNRGSWYGGGEFTHYNPSGLAKSAVLLEREE